MSRRSPFGVVAAVLALLVPAPAAIADPPPNDAPAGAVDLAPYTAQNGVPTMLQGVAELVEATPDPGIEPCLGASSFARTVWFRLPPIDVPTEVTIEASGRRTDVLDLAAFVQDEHPAPPAPAPDQPPPPPPPPPPPTTAEPQACDGRGAGGSGDARVDPTAAVSLIVPARHAVLVQVARRGAVRSAGEERALVTAEVAEAQAIDTPRGDRAGSVTPKLRGQGLSIVDLGGASLTSEDPAQPSCPSLGTVWRRLVPGSTGSRLVTVRGNAATTLTAFEGRRPAGDNVLDCVNRESRGELQLLVPVRRGRTIWIRLGAERTLGIEDADVRVADGRTATVIDGGSGGFDPTPGGPGGGFPVACDRADMTRSRISGPRLRGRARARNAFARVPVSVRLRGDAVCDAELRLFGPGGRIFAKGREVRLRPGRRVVALPRLRTFKPGRYRLRVRGVTLRGKRATVAGSVTGRLTR